MGWNVHHSRLHLLGNKPQGLMQFKYELLNAQTLEHYELLLHACKVPSAVRSLLSTVTVRGRSSIPLDS